jgi:uncharacterized protein (DUF1697 family)
VKDSYVALIRGINVGRANRVAMADLRALLSDLGYLDVRTLLNSGNAAFSAPGKTAAGVAASIQHGLGARLHVEARVVAVSAVDLAAAIAENPFPDRVDEPSRLVVAFLSDPSDRARLLPLAGQDWAPEALALGARVAYLWCPAGIATSHVSRAVGLALGDVVTARNWSTVLKLATLVSDRRRRN